MLNINSISKTFNKGTINEFDVFKDFNLEVRKDDFITIVGSNGAGKSTLMNIIAGGITIDSGEIIINHKDISHLKEHKRSKFIGRVFQDPVKGTSPSMTILENLSLAYNKNKSYGLGLCVEKKNINYFKEQLSQLNLGLEDKINTKVGLLSGGQRQALSLLMAVMIKPNILLLDEHTAALDPNTAENIISLTDNIVKERKITTIMITHNLNHAVSFGNRLIMMHKGNTVMDLNEKEKSSLTTEELIGRFKNLVADNDISDRVLLA